MLEKCLHLLKICISNIMNNENSVNALFVEPNAYISNCVKPKNETKKIVFQQPYETVPNFFINNGFHKKNCNCVPSEKKKECHDKQPCCSEQHKNKPCSNGDCGGFNIQNFLPLLGLFGSGKSAIDISKISSILNSSQQNEGSGIMSLMSSLLANKDAFSGILKMFSGNKTSNPKSDKNSIKSTDFEIKNYTRVD